MKFLSLFSGIGGFDLGLERSRMKCDSVCEIDPSAMKVLKKHFPKAKVFTDVKEVGIATHKRHSIDLICGGFPCQDVSVAGKRAGLDGERSGLWWEFARVIDELEPQWVVIENVPGLLSSCGCPSCGAARRIMRIHAYLRRKRKVHKPCAICTALERMLESHKGRDFAKIIHWLVERGYGVAWRILDAQYFGVPQRRRRVFIVGHLGDGRAAEVLFESEGGTGNPPTRGQAGQDTAYTLRANSSHSCDKGDGGINTTLVADVARPLGAQAQLHHRADMDTLIIEQNTQVSTPDMISLRANPAQPLVLAFDANQDGRDVSEDIAPTLLHSGDGKSAHGAYAKISVMAHGQAHAEILDDQSPTLTDNHEQPIVWEMSHASEAVRESGDQSPTLQQRMGTGGNQVPMVGIRRLTPVECERLQGFPDGWTQGHADSSRYRMLGNAVAVPVAEWIGKRIKAVS